MPQLRELQRTPNCIFQLPVATVVEKGERPDLEEVTLTEPLLLREALPGKLTITGWVPCLDRNGAKYWLSIYQEVKLVKTAEDLARQYLESL